MAAAELDRYLKGSGALAGDKRPRRYAFVEELPYTPTGKKQHFKLRAQVAQDEKAGRLVAPTR